MLIYRPGAFLCYTLSIFLPVDILGHFRVFLICLNVLNILFFLRLCIFNIERFYILSVYNVNFKDCDLSYTKSAHQLDKIFLRQNLVFCLGVCYVVTYLSFFIK